MEARQVLELVQQVTDANSTIYEIIMIAAAAQKEVDALTVEQTSEYLKPLADLIRSTP